MAAQPKTLGARSTRAQGPEGRLRQLTARDRPRKGAPATRGARPIWAPTAFEGGHEVDRSSTSACGPRDVGATSPVRSASAAMCSTKRWTSAWESVQRKGGRCCVSSAHGGQRAVPEHRGEVNTVPGHQGGRCRVSLAHRPAYGAGAPKQDRPGAWAPGWPMPRECGTCGSGCRVSSAHAGQRAVPAHWSSVGSVPGHQGVGTAGLMWRRETTPAPLPGGATVAHAQLLHAVR